jgi:superfamily II DNA helicase RecQ
MLRHLFPRVPILALSATCPNKVLEDLISILSMKRTVDGNGMSMCSCCCFNAQKITMPIHYLPNFLSRRARRHRVLFSAAVSQEPSLLRFAETVVFQKDLRNYVRLYFDESQE